MENTGIGKRPLKRRAWYDEEDDETTIEAALKLSQQDECVVVFCLDDRKFSVIPLSSPGWTTDVRTNRPEVDDLLDYIWSNKKPYKVMIKAIGSKKHCEHKMEVLLRRANQNANNLSTLNATDDSFVSQCVPSTSSKHPTFSPVQSTSGTSAEIFCQSSTPKATLPTRRQSMISPLQHEESDRDIYVVSNSVQNATSPSIQEEQSELVSALRSLDGSVRELIRAQRVSNSNVVAMTNEVAAMHGNFVNEARRLSKGVKDFKEIITKMKFSPAVVSGVPGHLLSTPEESESSEASVIWENEAGSVDLLRLSLSNLVTRYARDIFRALVPDRAGQLKYIVEPTSKQEDGREPLPQDLTDLFKRAIFAKFPPGPPAYEAAKKSVNNIANELKKALKKPLASSSTENTTSDQ